jgi:uncharacterized protein YndB with AHSA1/START domain
VIGTTDPVAAAGLVTREVRSGSRDGRPTRIAIARRRYAAERPDVWDTLTNPERLPRWFLPVSGDLVVGGRYQLEGNAGGVVETCEAPETLAVTWEYGDLVSWLRVELGEADGGTTLELRHEAHVDPEHWVAQFGPGAVGIGWDLSLYALGLYLLSARPSTPPRHGLADHAGRHPVRPGGRRGLGRGRDRRRRRRRRGPGRRGARDRVLHGPAGGRRRGVRAGLMTAGPRSTRWGTRCAAGSSSCSARASGRPARSRTRCTSCSGSPSRPPPSTCGCCAGRAGDRAREGTRRIYGVDVAGLAVAREWLDRFADPFAQPLDALATELARGRRTRRRPNRRRRRAEGRATTA